MRPDMTRSANRALYAIAMGLALYLAVICGPKILFTRDLGLQMPLLALLSVPLWALLTAALQMARRGSGYAWRYRKTSAQRPRSSARISPWPEPTLRRQVGQMAQNMAAPPLRDQSGPSPIFRTSRLQS
jgi:hypothetical protein